MAINTSPIYTKAGTCPPVAITTTTLTSIVTGGADGSVIHGIIIHAPGKTESNVIKVSLFDGSLTTVEVDQIKVPEVIPDPTLDDPVVPWSHFYFPEWMRSLVLETGAVSGFILPQNYVIKFQLYRADAINVVPIVGSLTA